MSHSNHVQLWAKYSNGLDRSASSLYLDEYEVLDAKRMNWLSRDIVSSNLGFAFVPFTKAMYRLLLRVFKIKYTTIDRIYSNMLYVLHRQCTYYSHRKLEFYIRGLNIR